MRQISCLILLFFFLIILPQKIDAAILFQDGFDEPERQGSFPTKWETYTYQSESSCDPAIWKIEGGYLKVNNFGGCFSHLIPTNEQLGATLNSYVIELDAKFLTGVDRHIIYKLDKNTPLIRVIHFQSPGDFTVDSDNPFKDVYIAKNYIYDQWYHFRIVVTPMRVQVYVSDSLDSAEVLVRDIVHISPLLSGTVGLGSNNSTAETHFDNFTVSSLNDPEPTPTITSVPTLTPTETPTPTVTSIPTITPTPINVLQVPLLKQTDNQWRGIKYDSANLWSSNKTDIETWGCALTSAAMVFQYHGVKKMKDGSPLTPKTLNQWLLSQPDGYVANGLVNWLALQRLPKEVKSKNSLSFNALEYERKNYKDDEYVKNALENNVPAILEVPNHFVVAKGYDESNLTFAINDPYYARQFLSDGYVNDYRSVGVYKKSNTDLSYMMFIVNPDLNFSVTDAEGTLLSDAYYQETIVDPAGLSENPSSAMNFHYVQKPSTGRYFIKVSNDGPDYTFEAYMYDRQGRVKKVVLNGEGGGIEKTFIVIFDKEKTQNDAISKLVTFDSLKFDIQKYYQQKKIKNIGAYSALLSKLELARITRIKVLQKALLDSMIMQIKGEKRTIDSMVANQLIQDIQSLKLLL